MPDYREARTHREFVTNLPIDRESLVAAVDAAWPAETSLSDWPSQRVALLVTERFSRESWNFEFN
jgi:hypothetical protein